MKNVGLLATGPVTQGAAQLSGSVIAALTSFDTHRWTVIGQGRAPESHAAMTAGFSSIAARDPLSVRVAQGVARQFGIWAPAGRFGPLTQLGLDLLVATPSASTAGLYARIPYVCWIADIMHLYYDDLPEYGWKTRWHRRVVYPSAARGSVLCVADSELGASQLVEKFGLRADRVKWVDFIAPPSLTAQAAMSQVEARHRLANYNLPERFAFYPAQFWAHKNHRTALLALQRLRDEFGLHVPLVLAGSDKGHRTEVESLVDHLGLRDQVHFLGYVSDVELAALYRASTLTLFVSLFGPSNIPPVEAMALGSPLICSNLFGMPNQVGDAGLLVDPLNVRAVSDAIRRLWGDTELRVELSRKGLVRSAQYGVSEFASRWLAIVDEALALVAAHGPSVSAAEGGP